MQRLLLFGFISIALAIFGQPNAHDPADMQCHRDDIC